MCYCQDWSLELGTTWSSRETAANYRASVYTKIATYRDDYHFRHILGCLLLVLQSLTQAYAVPYTAICRHADAYSKPSGLHGFLRYYSLSYTVAYSAHFSSYSCSFLYVYIRCLYN